MRLRVMLVSFCSIALSLLVLSPHRAVAGITMIGNMASWQASPSQSIDDKVFTWLGSSAGWDGSELVFISSNATADVHSLNLDTLTTYSGPLTLTVDYRIDITSNDVFAAIGLDTDTLAPNAAAYKDVFSSLSLLENAVGVGSGDLAALQAINGFPAWTTLPAIQQIWVRDTLQLNTTGQLNSVSNSVLQTVPEPSSVVLAGVAFAALTTWRSQRRPQRPTAA